MSRDPTRIPKEWEFLKCGRRTDGRDNPGCRQPGAGTSERKLAPGRCFQVQVCWSCRGAPVCRSTTSVANCAGTACYLPRCSTARARTSSRTASASQTALPSLAQQVLHPTIRRDITGVLGQGPTVLPRCLRDQALHQRPCSLPGLHPGETVLHTREHQLQLRPPAGRVYAVPHGHHTILMSPHIRS